MAFGPNEGSVTLCFALFSQLRTVQALVSRIAGNRGMYDGAGYKCVPPALLDVFRRAGCIRAPHPNRFDMRCLFFISNYYFRY